MQKLFCNLRRYKYFFFKKNHKLPFMSGYQLEKNKNKKRAKDAGEMFNKSQLVFFLEKKYLSAALIPLLIFH